MKKMNEDELRAFRTRFGIPIADSEIGHAPFYRPAEDSPETKYMRERRQALGDERLLPVAVVAAEGGGRSGQH